MAGSGWLGDTHKKVRFAPYSGPTLSQYRPNGAYRPIRIIK